ncbi:MAG: tyrosine-type recombinase/integrase [Clostridia bacterium]|nr:tyrosine-type recombinase/integrase [Clostridia bacterium]MDE7328697.1 tyrosine-type recombinase/integrase [Clostridia bacterium]
MAEKSYFEQRNFDCNVKLRHLLRDLPTLCNEFFLGIENRTSILTRLGYAQDLKIFFNFLHTECAEFVELKDVRQFGYDELRKVDTFHIEMFLNYLTAFEVDGTEYSNSAKTKARKLATIKSFFKFFYNKDKIPSDPASKVLSLKLHDKAIIRLEVDEVSRLLDNVESGAGLTPKQLALQAKTRKRDVAILTLFLGTGIRISELVGIDIKDIDFNVNGFKITRKGGNQTILYFNDEVADALLQYLDERAQNPLLDDVSALFVSLQNKRITVRAVQNLVKKYATVTTPLKHITPHKLRSTYGTNLYKETNDIYVVAEVLGHKDINTTKRHYAAISDDIKRNAARRVTLRNKDEV